MPLRTYIAEDQTLFRTLLVKLINDKEGFELIGQSPRGEEALEQCLRLKPDLAIVDIRLIGMDGIELGQQLRDQLPETRRLAVTTLTDPFTIKRIRETGFHGYVEKNQPVDVLEEALDTIESGRSYFSPVMEVVKNNLVQDPFSFYKILSEREQQILRKVAQGETSKAIAEDLGLSRRTVQNHRYNIMQKLEIHDLPSLTRYAVENGLI
ncbi:response regulator transcription factor [Rubellicoccus peritrichatus]|uniref:Response regulator transcription factor n=1 Tax=Rubellicoccus peritrichatus TaxID=3080537 RepID=A0AAQ3QU88_9BACT|nr:response regulator transcription factor [Puniceicoccus sp. CR14]WOO39392.1 response regulator transcription factor [Puniceicoccus sp. CR14]